MKRRDLLKSASALGAGATAKGLLPSAAAAQAGADRWPDPVANEILPYQTGGLTHGPELGRPTATSVRVWLRTAKPASFKIVYGASLPLSADAAGVGGRTLEQHDNTGFADLTGLKPNTRYYYGVAIDGSLVDTRIGFHTEFPSFRTLPDGSTCADPKYNPEGRFNFRFSVGCCEDQHPTRSGWQYSNPPVFATMLQKHGRQLSFHLMNGDFIYEELRDDTVNGVRANYKLYYERGQTMSNFFRHVPALFTYDDHEISCDEGPGEVGLKKGKWNRRDIGLAPYQEYAAWANFEGPHHQPIRFGKASVKKGDNILHDPSADFTTLRPEATSTILVLNEFKNAGVYRHVAVVDGNHLKVEPAFTQDEECGYSIGTRHYYDWKVGNCHFFALDARGECNRFLPERAHDPERTILGEKQLNWLMEGVRNTDAQFIFLVSPVSWVIYHTDAHVLKGPNVQGRRSPKEDGFNGAVVEREKLLKLFESLEKQFIIFTGDLHCSFAVQITPNIWEFMVGPMNSAAHPISTAGDPPFAGWFDAEGRKVKIKWLASWPDEVNYSRLHPTVYGVVQVNNVLRSGKQNGPGLHWIAYDAPQVVMQFYDGYTGELLYAEGISAIDSRRS